MNFANGNVYVYFCHWIQPAHDKIALCICDQRKWFFWFNSKPAFHGHGQLQVAKDSHPAITKDCYLNLSGVRAASGAELQVAADRGPVTDPLKAAILAALAVPITLLPEVQRQIAYGNLSVA